MDKLLWGDSGLRDAADNIILDAHQMIVTRMESLPMYVFMKMATRWPWAPSRTRTLPCERLIVGPGPSRLSAV